MNDGEKRGVVYEVEIVAAFTILLTELIQSGQHEAVSKILTHVKQGTFHYGSSVSGLGVWMDAPEGQRYWADVHSRHLSWKRNERPRLRENTTAVDVEPVQVEAPEEVEIQEEQTNVL